MPPFATCKTMFSFRNNPSQHCKTMFSFQNSPSQPAKPCFHFKTVRRNLRNHVFIPKQSVATCESRFQNHLALLQPCKTLFYFQNTLSQPETAVAKTAWPWRHPLQKKAPRLRGCYSIILYITNRLSPSRGLLSHSRHRYKAIRPCNQASDCVQSLIQWHHSPSPSRIYNDTCPS